MMHHIALALALVLLGVSMARAYEYSTAAAQADRVTDLPGLTDAISFSQYSGYLDLPGTAKHMHYWFVEAEVDDPLSAPLAFWTNGGPGCSGLLGFMEGTLHFSERHIVQCTPTTVLRVGLQLCIAVRYPLSPVKRVARGSNATLRVFYCESLDSAL